MNKHIKFHAHAWDFTFVSMILILLGIAVIFFSSISLAQEPWTTRAPMPTATSATTSTVGGKIYAFGGGQNKPGTLGFTTNEEYDPASDSWTVKKDMPTGRLGASASAVNGMIYVIGGRESSDGLLYSIVEMYDPATDTWDTTKTPMPTARLWLSTSVVDGKIYAIGGEKYIHGTVLSVVEEYDPETDTWTTKAPMPTPRWGLSTSVVNGKIYAIGGCRYTSSPFPGLSTVEEYDPATDIWTTKADMPTARFCLSTSMIDELIYAIGGLASSNGPFYGTVEAYDPVTNSWVNKTLMPTARAWLSTSVVGGKIYTISGISCLHCYPVDTNEEYTPHLDLGSLIENVNVNRHFVNPGIDSVCISATVTDPAGITLMAELVTTDQTTPDSLQLFDDGNHNDDEAGDSLYANVWPAGIEEQRYDVDLQVTRVDTDTVIHRMDQMAAFTTIGPVIFDSFSFTGSDTEPNPGDNIRIYVTLKNNGKTTSATDIEAQLVSLEASWVRVRTETQAYPDIPAGETAQNSTSYRLEILDAYPGDTPIPMEIHISSHGTVFWSDSFSITADLTDVQSMVKSGPARFALSDNYPNPFNPETTIAYAVKEPCEVRLIVTNLLCQTVKELIHSYHQPDTYTVHVNMDENSSGLYFYQISMGDFQAVKKMVKIE